MGNRDHVLGNNRQHTFGALRHVLRPLGLDRAHTLGWTGQYEEDQSTYVEPTPGEKRRAYAKVNRRHSRFN